MRYWFVAPLLLAVATQGCSEPSADAAAAESSELVAGATPVSANGTDAARAALRLASFLSEGVSTPSATALTQFVPTLNLSAVHVARAAGSKKFFFDGNATEGDIIGEPVQLVVTETPPANPEEGGSTYEAVLSRTEPQGHEGAASLPAEEVALLGALLLLAERSLHARATESTAAFKKFARFDTQLDSATRAQAASGPVYTLSGTIFEGGDIVVGNATMKIEDRGCPNPESCVIDLRATTTIRHR